MVWGDFDATIADNFRKPAISELANTRDLVPYVECLQRDAKLLRKEQCVQVSQVGLTSFDALQVFDRALEHEREILETETGEFTRAHKFAARYSPGESDPALLG
jgi:hypothetical protein